MPTTGGGLDDGSPAVWNNIVLSGFTYNLGNGTMVPYLFRINAANGQVFWYFKSAGHTPRAEEFTAVSVWNGIVYSDALESGTLYAVNATNGEMLWSYQTGPNTSNVNIYDGNLRMVNTNGTLLVINPTTGTLLTSTNLGVPLQNGNLVFVDQNVIIWGNDQVISMPVSDIYPGN
jgi:outer membrane protein assembly factor BamB